jgi:hypothetical protein
MQIYDRSIPFLTKDDQFQVFLIYINRATQLFGVTKTREIFEKAIDVLENKYQTIMAIKYANLERKLGEIDRARAIYIHSSNFANPDVDKKFWDTWFEFERLHGNLDTAKEMLRIKRSVSESYGITKFESNTHSNIESLKRKRDPIENLEDSISNNNSNENVGLKKFKSNIKVEDVEVN